MALILKQEELYCPDCGREYEAGEELVVGGKCPSDDCPSHRPKLKYPIDRVGSARGAPMGRSNYGTPESSTGKLRLFHVPLDQGYDAGGAYWGWPNDLYCAYEPAEDGYLAFTRARNRKEACEELGIDPARLFVPLGAKVFGRYHAD